MFLRPAVRRAPGAVRLPAVAVLVECQRMAVHLSAGRVAQNEARGPLVVRTLEFRERRADAVDVLHADAEIEVLVRTRLLAEQRIDAPATFDPKRDSGRVEALDGGDDVVRGQRCGIVAAHGCALARSGHLDGGAPARDTQPRDAARS